MKLVLTAEELAALDAMRVYAESNIIETKKFLAVMSGLSEPIGSQPRHVVMTAQGVTIVFCLSFEPSPYGLSRNLVISLPPGEIGINAIDYGVIAERLGFKVKNPIGHPRGGLFTFSNAGVGIIHSHEILGN